MTGQSQGQPAGVRPASESTAKPAGARARLGSLWRVARWHPDRAAIAVVGALAVANAATGSAAKAELAALGSAVVLEARMRRIGPGRRRSRVAVALLLALTAVVGVYAVVVASYLVVRHAPGVAFALGRATAALVDDGGRSLAPIARLGLNVFTPLALGAFVFALRALFAPTRTEDGHSAAEHARAAALVDAYGTDSIAPFILRADKAFFFAHGGVLAYRTMGETAVVSGDPVGPPGTAAAILAEFLAFADARVWDVVVVGARAEQVAAYRRLGLRTMPIGSEAVVDPQGFVLTGRARKTVRKAVHRVERLGWTVEVVLAPRLTAAVAAEIDAVERAWRGRRQRLYGFAMASDRLWGAPEDAEDVYALARAPSGELRAFQRYVPYRGGLSLDAMRRLDDEPNGINDALVAAVLEHARECGLREVSLNFAGFAHLMAADSLERRSQRLARSILRRLHGRFQLERLLRFTAKFGPSQRPRYLVFARRTRLPIAAMRVMQAEAYVKPPPCRLRQDAWRPSAVPIVRAPQRVAG